MLKFSKGRMLKRISPRARDMFNHVVEAKRFDGLFLCKSVC